MDDILSVIYHQTADFKTLSIISQIDKKTYDLCCQKYFWYQVFTLYKLYEPKTSYNTPKDWLNSLVKEITINKNIKNIIEKNEYSVGIYLCVFPEIDFNKIAIDKFLTNIIDVDLKITNFIENTLLTNKLYTIIFSFDRSCKTATGPVWDITIILGSHIFKDPKLIVIIDRDIVIKFIYNLLSNGIDYHHIRNMF